MKKHQQYTLVSEERQQYPQGIKRGNTTGSWSKTVVIFTAHEEAPTIHVTVRRKARHWLVHEKDNIIRRECKRAYNTRSCPEKGKSSHSVGKRNSNTHLCSEKSNSHRLRLIQWDIKMKIILLRCYILYSSQNSRTKFGSEINYLEIQISISGISRLA